MSIPNITRWIGVGLLGLPLYGVLTFFSSIDPQPDPDTHLEAWARFVRTVLVGALVLVVGGWWIAWSVLRQSSAGAAGVAAQPRLR